MGLGYSDPPYLGFLHVAHHPPQVLDIDNQIGTASFLAARFLLTCSFKQFLLLSDGEILLTVHETDGHLCNAKLVGGTSCLKMWQ